MRRATTAPGSRSPAAVLLFATVTAIAAPAAVARPTAAGAQEVAPPARDLAARARAPGDAPLRLSFPARPEVCGAGDGILIREPDGSTMFVSGRTRHHDGSRWQEGDPPCETGDVVVRMQREGGVVSRVAVSVVGRADRVPREHPDEVDLGRAAGQEAADFLLAEARTASDRAGDDLVLAASLADGARTWPTLARMGRDRSLPRRTRRSAIHWLGRQAAEEAVAELGGIVRDRTEEDAIREAAVFGLSQLPDERAVTLLIDVVRTVDDPRVRKHALFWLADSEDPRALAVFEEILASGAGGSGR